VSGTQDVDDSAKQEWFAVRCVFQHGTEAPFTYEERITVWRAASFDAAVAQAEADAAAYADQADCVHLGFAQAYRMYDELGHGAEVYSLMRDSDLPGGAYLTAFFDTGDERQGTVDG
jgi:hypothetical protein